MNINFFAFIVIFFIVINGLWYYIRHVTHKSGYKSNFWDNWQDVRNLHDLIRQEQNPSKKRKLKALLFSFYGAAIVFFIGFFPCASFNSP